MSRNGERETLERFLDPIHLDPVESELEVEAFYTLGRELSFFAQLRLGLVEDLLDGTPDEVSDLYVERGEMWLYAEDIADSHLNFDVGRLNFEDDRRWWWDDDIDAVRVAYETQTVEIAVALARQLGPSRSERRFVEPEDDRGLRVLGEASWKWHENHVLELFALYSDDHSPTPQPGDLVPPDREDESDARLTWIGGRGMGVFDLEERGLLGYWLDAAWVWGDERFLEFEEFSPHRGVVSSLTRRDVQGWAFDAGVNWLLPLAWEPRLYAGYAFGSGGRHSEGGADRSFRQTGIQANEAGFGGVEHFPTYGILLDPELSNLGILTLGAGISAFRTGSAFGRDEGSWSFGGFVDFAINF